MFLTVGVCYYLLLSWTSVVSQSLRPNIHMSVGTRWGSTNNSKAAATTTPSVPQQRLCLSHFVQQPPVRSPPEGEREEAWERVGSR